MPTPIDLPVIFKLMYLPSELGESPWVHNAFTFVVG